MKAVAIFNPNAGRKQAARRLEQWRRRLALPLDLWPTNGPGHGEQLALQAVEQGFDLVVAAGGDGTVHEVANGLLRAGRREVQLGIVPLGSANDYAASLKMDAPSSPTSERWVDVGVVRDPTGRQRHFICCLGLGLNGGVTLEARRISWLQGMPLYLLATLRALWRHYSCAPLELTLDDQPPAATPTLMMSVMVGRREGGFVMAPQAHLDDGLFDYVHALAMSRWQALGLLPRLALAGPPRGHPKVRLGRCQRIQLKSERPLIVHIDGEFFCQPEDQVRELEIVVEPRALCVRTSTRSC